jgi:putative ABC transport system ATP-binding protein
MGEAARSAWRAHNMGIVFQFYNLLPMLSVAENVELPLLLKPLSRQERRLRVDKGSISSGWPARETISRFDVRRPAAAHRHCSRHRLRSGLLLCDEPTGDLDRKSADEVLDMLRFLNRELQKTIVMVTHDPQAALYARRTLHLDKGDFVEEKRAA